MCFLENERYIYALHYRSCSSKHFSNPGLDLDSLRDFSLISVYPERIQDCNFLTKARIRKHRYFGGHGETASFGHCVGKWEVNLW